MPEGFSGWNYIAYFTVLTNIVVDVWLIFFGVCRLAGAKEMEEKITHPLLMGGLTLSIFIVGFLYYSVLFWVIGLYPWSLWWGNLADIWHHAVMPIFITVLWLCPMDNRKADKKKLWLWLIYPLAYFAVSMIRGIFIEWYPYPFLDPNDQMLLNLPIHPYISIAVVVAALTGMFYGFGRLAMGLRNRTVARQ
jgi:hypothetical protein